MEKWVLDVIAQTKEKYMMITANVPVDTSKEGKLINFQIKFQDSYQFLTSSLANLVHNLETLPITQTLKCKYKNVSDDMLRRKGVFPYNYFSSLDKLQETSLPPKAAFKNDLTGEDCSDEDYEHAKQACREFECKSFEDYMLVSILKLRCLSANRHICGLPQKFIK